MKQLPGSIGLRVEGLGLKVYGSKGLKRCVCVCERERENVCENVCECVCERMCVRMCVCVCHNGCPLSPYIHLQNRATHISVYQ